MSRSDPSIIPTASSMLSSGLVSLKGLLKTALAGIAVGKITKQAIGMSDEYANMHARLDMIRDSTQTTEELQKSIYTSAQRTGSAYTTMANGVAKMRMQAGDVFHGTFSLRHVERTFRMAKIMLAVHDNEVDIRRVEG